MYPWEIFFSFVFPSQLSHASFFTCLSLLKLMIFCIGKEIQSCLDLLVLIPEIQEVGSCQFHVLSSSCWVWFTDQWRPSKCWSEWITDSGAGKDLSQFIRLFWEAAIKKLAHIFWQSALFFLMFYWYHSCQCRCITFGKSSYWSIAQTQKEALIVSANYRYPVL
jgi:hypothetical protein